MGAAVASGRFQWVGPTPARKYRGTVEQGNFIRWMGEHLFHSHEDHHGFDVVLAQAVPSVAKEQTTEISTTLLGANVGKAADGIGEVRTTESVLGTVNQIRPVSWMSRLTLLRYQQWLILVGFVRWKNRLVGK